MLANAWCAPFTERNAVLFPVVPLNEKRDDYMWHLFLLQAAIPSLSSAVPFVLALC